MLHQGWYGGANRGMFAIRQALKEIDVPHKTVQYEGMDKSKKNGFTEPIMTGCAALFIFPILAFVAIPSFTRINEKARSASAMNTIATIAMECAVKKVNGEINSTFDVPKLDKYAFTPTNGDCDGDANNLITAQSKNTEKYPTFSYNVEIGEKTCSHEGPTGPLNGCSARRNGEW